MDTNENRFPKRSSDIVKDSGVRKHGDHYDNSLPQKEVEELLKDHGYTGKPQTPSTDDPAAVIGPDDTFPGSGPNHPKE